MADATVVASTEHYGEHKPRKMKQRNTVLRRAPSHLLRLAPLACRKLVKQCISAVANEKEGLAPWGTRRARVLWRAAGAKDRGLLCADETAQLHKVFANLYLLGVMRSWRQR